MPHPGSRLHRQDASGFPLTRARSLPGVESGGTRPIPGRVAGDVFGSTVFTRAVWLLPVPRSSTCVVLAGKQGRAKCFQIDLNPQPWGGGCRTNPLD